MTFPYKMLCEKGGIIPHQCTRKLLLPQIGTNDDQPAPPSSPHRPPIELQLPLIGPADTLL